MLCDQRLPHLFADTNTQNDVEAASDDDVVVTDPAPAYIEAAWTEGLNLSGSCISCFWKNKGEIRHYDEN